MLLFFMGRIPVPHSNPAMKERGKKTEGADAKGGGKSRGGERKSRR